MPLDGEALANWLSARAGKLTASNMARALSVKKDGSPTADRTNLIREILAERMTGSSVPHYVSPAMEHGLEFEEEAKAAYEAHTGEFVSPCGFYDHPRIDLFGATPDGLVGAHGLIETKCPTTTTFIGWRMAGVVPPEHVPQMLAQLACCGRKWCDFVAYDPRIRDARARIIVHRFMPTADEIADLEAKAEAFLAEVDAAWEILTTAAA